MMLKDGLEKMKLEQRKIKTILGVKRMISEDAEEKKKQTKKLYLSTKK